VAISLVVVVPLTIAASEQDTQAQIEALQAQIKVLQEQNQKQIESLQTQVDILKEQLTKQTEEKEEILSKIELPSQQPPRKWKFGRTPKSGEESTFLVRKPRQRTGILGLVQKSDGFRLGDAMGFDEESPVNIAFEINMRHRQNINDEGSSPGFQFYEIGLMADAQLNDWTAGYIEYNLHHSTASEPEDVWIDLHLPEGPMAYAGGTGLKIGHFHAPFGWDNDDCEGFVYGGRTTVNAPLMRHEPFDGQTLRERQIGIQANYNWEVNDNLRLIFSGGVFNGNGDANHYGGKDNDRKKDWVGRVEAQFLNAALGASYWYAPSTGGATANTTAIAHPRAISRYGVHFKYPNDVPFPGSDPALGDGKYLIWGEAMYGQADAASSISSLNDTQKFWSGYIEADVPIIKNKVLGFCRVDYWEPDLDNDGVDDIIGVTPGIYLTLWPGLSVLTLEYEWYHGGTQDDNDRIAAELQIFF
jgi:hypothetical protein